MKKLRSVILLLSGFFFFSSAKGQDAASIMLNQQMNNQAGLINIQQMQRSFDAQNEAGKRAATSGNSRLPETNAWKVDHDPLISRKLRTQYIANIATSNGQEVAGKTDKFFGDIQTTFGKMTAPFGLHQNNYVDVVTAYLVVMWMSVNRQTQVPSIANVQAVRRQCQHSLSSGKVSRPTAQQLQLAAETFMYQACSAVAMREQAVRDANPKLLDKLATQASAILSKEHIYLNNVALTNNGFTKK